MKRPGRPAGEDFADNRVPGKGQNKARKSLTDITELDNQIAVTETHLGDSQGVKSLNQ